MTLIVGIAAKKSIWLVADRRLSRSGIPDRDDAMKILALETIDARALIGYAGLGATAQKTQPSDWMARALRGQNVKLEAALQILANAIDSRLPKHLKGLPAG